MLKKILRCITLLILCSCSVLEKSHADSMIVKDVTPTVYPHQESAAFPVSTVESLASIQSITVSLECSTYWETNWGTGNNQLGYNSKVEGNPGPFFPPVFDESGNIYIADRFNHRILVFAGGEEIRSISTPSTWPQEGADDTGKRWSNLVVQRGSLYLRFSEWVENRVIDKLGIFTFDDQHWKIIDLAPYYPHHSILAQTITANGSGGVYIRLDPGLVYFDAQHYLELIYPGLTADETLLLGWDKNLYLYAYHSDKLTGWSEQRRPFIDLTQPTFEMYGVFSFLGQRSANQLPLHRQFLGADVYGQIYLSHSRSDVQTPWIISRLLPDERMLIGEIPPYILSAFTKLSLAPDGRVYGMTYDPEDISILPRIIQCHF